MTGTIAYWRIVNATQPNATLVASHANDASVRANAFSTAAMASIANANPQMSVMNPIASTP
jgi:hypothetical protein